jgi:hypothetical protein
MSPHTVRNLRRLIAAMMVLAIGVIAALTIGLIAQTSASSAAKKAAAVSAQRTIDLQTELARFKAFTGDVLCGVLQPLGVLKPPPNITTIGLTLLHGAKHGSDKLACPAPKRH